MSIRFAAALADQSWDYDRKIGGKIKDIKLRDLGASTGDGKVSKDELKKAHDRIVQDLNNLRWTSGGRDLGMQALGDIIKLENDFAKYDKNNDGFVSNEETMPGKLTAVPSQPTPKLVAYSIKHNDLYDAFKAADNGTTTQYKQAIGGKKVKRVDINENGGDRSITKDEVNDRLSKLEESVSGRRFTDAGKESYNKAKALLKSVLEKFDVVDTNKNGKIDNDER